MKFQFSEKKVKLPGNVHAYAEKKVMKLARYFEEDAEALIIFSVEKTGTMWSSPSTVQTTGSGLMKALRICLPPLMPLWAP